MAIVTLLTDSGENDHYAAAIRARILSINPGIKIVDITHRIPPFHIAHAAFVLRSVFRDFPQGTVHLVGVHATGNPDDKPIALQLEDHFFVGSDNGLFGLISEKMQQNLVELNAINPVATTFPERDILAPAAAKLASGVPISSLGKPLSLFKKMIDRQAKATKKQIVGNVIHVDYFGNLITNIHKETFDILSRDKVFTVQAGTEKFRKIHSQYSDVEEGECVLLFNALNLLEIAINKGNAAELLGLEYGSPVIVYFE
ncbi:MAG: SAM-dependent chlorinase/fluorinase [Cyclobacteriaceae bacterium]|nr:SAM-dependent chlorinase/fluorinase [Cyclobacteriaceae bacterium]MCX7637997.1 SAM-dependent chlorinase/fluorinase [Cyclobacteriaceae bacterium]MDW8331562.1 SAM-dependent chlorinase/fluorinase [Cyclobacteriaceae bacterium]